MNGVARNERQRCKATHWHQGEELRCIDVEGHDSAHYNVVWWPNKTGLPNAPRARFITHGCLVLVVCSPFAVGIVALIYWLLHP